MECSARLDRSTKQSVTMVHFDNAKEFLAMQRKAKKPQMESTVIPINLPACNGLGEHMPRILKQMAQALKNDRRLAQHL